MLKIIKMETESTNSKAQQLVFEEGQEVTVEHLDKNNPYAEKGTVRSYDPNNQNGEKVSILMFEGPKKGEVLSFTNKGGSWKHLEGNFYASNSPGYSIT